MLQSPRNRIQSDFYYIKSKPYTRHLSPDINAMEVFEYVENIIDFVLYPGISNCATKVSRVDIFTTTFTLLHFYATS